MRPVTDAEPNMGMGAEASDPASVDEDEVQEAQELKHVPAPVLPPKKSQNHTVSLICHFEAGVLPVFDAEDCHLLIAKSTQNRRRQTDTYCLCGLLGSFGSPRTERKTHSQCSSCEIARVKVSEVTQCHRRVWCTRILQGL